MAPGGGREREKTDGTEEQAKELCAIVLVSPKLIKQNLFANERMEAKKGSF
jgi:hypothetical protein